MSEKTRGAVGTLLELGNALKEALHLTGQRLDELEETVTFLQAEQTARKTIEETSRKPTAAQLPGVAPLGSDKCYGYCYGVCPSERGEPCPAYKKMPPEPEPDLVASKPPAGVMPADVTVEKIGNKGGWNSAYFILLWRHRNTLTEMLRVHERELQGVRDENEKLRDLVRRARPKKSLSSPAASNIREARMWLEERKAILDDPNTEAD